MNDSEYNNRYQRFGVSESCNAKPAAVRQLDNRDTFRLGDDMFKDSSYMQDYAGKAPVQVNRVKHRGGPSSMERLTIVHARYTHNPVNLNSSQFAQF